MSRMQDRIDNAEIQWASCASFGKAQWKGRVYRDDDGYFAVATHVPNGEKRIAASLQNITVDDFHDLQRNPLYRGKCEAVWRICSLSGAVANGFQCYENEIGARIERSFSAWTAKEGEEDRRRLAGTIYRDDIGYFAVVTQLGKGGQYEIAGWRDILPNCLPGEVVPRLCSPLALDLRETLYLAGVLPEQSVLSRDSLSCQLP